MVTEGIADTPQGTEDRERRSTGSGRRVRQTVAFLIAAAVVFVYALRGDGSFDLITRQENGLVIWWLLAVGIALGLLPQRRPGRAAAVAAGALALFAIWIAISLTWTESSERTTAELARSLDYLGLVVLIAVSLGRTTWRSAGLGWIAGAVGVCALAMASRLAPGSFPANHIGTVFGPSRLSYPFGYWNAVGAWCAMTATLTLAISANDRRPLPRALTLAAVPLAAATAYLTYSRGAIAGFAAGLIVVIALSRNRWTALLHALIAGALSVAVIETIRGEPQIAQGTGTSGATIVLLVLLGTMLFGALAAICTGALKSDGWRLSRRAALGVAGVGAVVLVVAAAAAGPHLASKAWNEFRHPKVTMTANPAARLTSLSGYRYQLWKVALDAFDRHPLQGTGAGTFEFWWNRHATESEFVQNAHSLWFETMAELGLPGLLLIVLFAASAIAVGVAALRRSRRRVSAAVCIAATSGLIVFLVQASADWIWQSTAVTVLALGAIAIVSTRASGERPRGSERPRLRIWLRAGLAALAAIIGLVQIPGLLSSAEINRSQSAAGAGNGATALAWADKAVSAEPWAASPYLQRGLVLESLGRLRAADADLKHAVRNEPTNFDLWAILSRIEIEQGHAAPAIKDLTRAGKLRPSTTLLSSG